MDKGPRANQTAETDIAKLAAGAKKEVASGKAKYFTVEEGEQGESNKILMWMIEHSPKWRSDGSEAIREEMRRLGL